MGTGGPSKDDNNAENCKVNYLIDPSEYEVQNFFKFNTFSFFNVFL